MGYFLSWRSWMFMLWSGRTRRAESSACCRRSVRFALDFDA
ncbi:hypothetical protein ACFPRL_02525 [Pseudoclavibacter helvolus]